MTDSTEPHEMVQSGNGNGSSPHAGKPVRESEESARRPAEEKLAELEKLNLDEIDKFSDKQIAGYRAAIKHQKLPLSSLSRNELYVVVKALPFHAKRLMQEKTETGVNLYCQLLRTESPERVLGFAYDVSKIQTAYGQLHPDDMGKKDWKNTKRAGRQRLAKAYLSMSLLAAPAGLWVGGAGAGLAAQGIEHIYHAHDVPGDSSDSKPHEKKFADAVPPSVHHAYDALDTAHDLVINKYWEILLALESLGAFPQIMKISKATKFELADQIGNATAELGVQFPEIHTLYDDQDRPHLRYRHKPGAAR